MSETAEQVVASITQHFAADPESDTTVLRRHEWTALQARLQRLDDVLGASASPPQVGDIWFENKRRVHRFVRVEKVVAGQVFIQTVQPEGTGWVDVPGTRTTIAAARRFGIGYTMYQRSAA